MRPTFARCLAASLLAMQPLASQFAWSQANPVGWPMMGGNPQHTNSVNASTPSAATASQLGLNWMANLHAADVGSPVAAFNAALGAMVVYAGDENGDVFAFNETTGQQIWGINLGLGNAIRATPAVAPDGSVWVATSYGNTVFKLNGATGQTLCSQTLAGGPIEASLNVATTPDGVVRVYEGTNDTVVVSGLEAGLLGSGCARSFTFNGFQTPVTSGTTGTWATTAYSVNASGTGGVILFGTADPDSTEYALDARTGALLWKWAANAPAGDYDIGEGAAISAPGVNGFAHGMAFVGDKYGFVAALDLTTGASLWQTNIYPPGYKGARDTRSGPAFTGGDVVYGFFGGVQALNPLNGSLLWQYSTPGVEVLSSPAVVGPVGREVVGFSDMTGAFHVVQLSNGAQLYSYQTGGYITASTAFANGHLITVSTDGFLYDFAVGGANAPPPSTTLSAPAPNAQIANPYGSVTVSGSAADSQGVAAVEVALAVSGATGLQWYNAATKSLQGAAVDNPATLSAPGATSTTWSFTFPAPASGGAYQVYASAVNVGRRADIKGVNEAFDVLRSPTAPVVQVSNAYVPPGGSFTVSGSGFMPGEVVSVSVNGNVLAQPMTNAAGAFPLKTVTLPALTPLVAFGNGAKLGPTALVATGRTSKLTTSTFFDVTNEWTQGAQGPTRVSFESNDSSFHTTINAGGGAFLTTEWMTPTGAKVESSPIVVNGVAYVGNDAGLLLAINTNDGAPQWQYQVPSGKPIQSSPAVDGSLVLFGGADGNLYEVNKQGGGLFATLAVGGAVGSPAVSNGVAYVGSDNGSVIAVVENHNGSPVSMWSASVGAAIHAPVAFDPSSANTPVIVGNDAGTITAFNGTTGKVLWTFKTGAAVTGAPTILNGTVYVGSQDGAVYALKEQTGSSVWTFNAGAPITVGGAAGRITASTTNYLAYGTAGGYLYTLNANNGAQLWASNIGQPVVGVAAAFDAVVVETSKGQVRVDRGEQGGEQVWSFQTGAPLNTIPAINNGVVYVGAQSTSLFAFTTYK